jgi:hypothetical protein
MYRTSITQRRQIVEIMIVRRKNDYLYNRIKDGQHEVKFISQERAEQIYLNNVHVDDRIGSGPVGDFDPAPCEWSLTIRLTEAVPS